ncbi:hypothetical protein GCM10011492_29690 [Flexivirga endophytica]|uniref:Uncharacterized protein n=1 Tax=Flexivirga endophytica TaxID=1849103 RepID=A0A916T9P1_9MICO|nr:hypothetical protein [Flexivirga endophytica]GGB37000.1 hypothetical protein GCM10011492_29690 [Flexivirga endophytica]GHB44563.1 hypothetical protein GCM10008112_12070 [Flexivirga endophytica]
MTTPREHKPIRTEHDLFERWEELMGDGGFGRRSLWLIFLDEEGRQSDLIVPIDDIPILPDSRDVHAIGDLIARVREEVGVAQVPMLLSRPGPSEITEGDRRWAIALTEALRDLRPQWPIHLATRDRVQVFAPDDLVAA